MNPLISAISKLKYAGGFAKWFSRLTLNPKMKTKTQKQKDILKIYRKIELKGLY